MNNEIYHHHFIARGDYQELVKRLDKISLQNIGNTHFTIAPEPPNKAPKTYVELKQGEGGKINIFIRTLRPQKKELLEESLSDVIRSFDVD